MTDLPRVKKLNLQPCKWKAGLLKEIESVKVEKTTNYCSKETDNSVLKTMCDFRSRLNESINDRDTSLWGISEYGGTKLIYDRVLL